VTVVTEELCGLVCAPGERTGAIAQNERFLGIWSFNSRNPRLRGAPPLSEWSSTWLNWAVSSTLAVVTDRGTSVEILHYNFDGAFHQTEGSDPRELSFRRVDPNTIDQQTRRSGQITVNRRIELSQDGKTMTFIASGTTGGGQKYEKDTRVYERK
jgi:hypothetical protein